MPHATPEARAAYNRAYREKHRERLLRQRRARSAADPDATRDYFREWYEGNRERVRANSVRWRSENRKRATESRAAWRRGNPDSHRISQARRRAQVAFGELSLREWRELLEEFDNRCAYCQGQGKLEVEHMTPLSRGGPHSKDNIVPACGSCNRRKSTHTVFEFLGIDRGLALEV